MIGNSSWNVMARGDAREGKWRGNWRMEWVAITLHTTSEHGVSSITTADAHTSADSSRLNWRLPAYLNELVHFAEKRNLVSARVQSHFNWPLPANKNPTPWVIQPVAKSPYCGWDLLRFSHFVIFVVGYRVISYGGRSWLSWLRQSATSREVAGSSPEFVIGIFYWLYPSGCSGSLVPTQFLIYMSRLCLKCDGTRAETRFRLSAKRTSPFKSAEGVSSIDYCQPRCAHQL